MARPTFLPIALSISSVLFLSLTWVSQTSRVLTTLLKPSMVGDAGGVGCASVAIPAATASARRNGSDAEGSGAASALPPHLSWNHENVEVPSDWSFRMPEECNKGDDAKRLPSATATAPNGTTTVVVHFHMQHNAGTKFYEAMRRFVPCATRACHQKSKHCLVSYNEQIEAENLRANGASHGVEYVSCEFMLPPRFPLPFVSESARRGLFFTTIVRDPFRRMLTALRRNRGQWENRMGPSSEGDPVWAWKSNSFWEEVPGCQGKRGCLYQTANLNVRWLAGARGDEITRDHVNVAKCRLRLFDLVISDELYHHSWQVICSLDGWKAKRACGNVRKTTAANAAPPKRKEKSDPLHGIDGTFVGAWIERLRPSFEIYDYARMLSVKHLRRHGATDLPEPSDAPSYLAMLRRYANATFGDKTAPRLPRVDAENERRLEPPEEFCDRMKDLWRSNPDEVPNAWGIGTFL